MPIPLLPVPPQNKGDELAPDAKIEDVIKAFNKLSQDYYQLQGISLQNTSRLSVGGDKKEKSGKFPTVFPPPLPEGLEVTNGSVQTKVNIRFDRLRVGPFLLEKKWDAAEYGTQVTTQGRRRTLPGTATWVQNDQTTTGTNTQFTQDFGIGDTITLTGHPTHTTSNTRTVISVTSDTSLEVDTAWDNIAAGTTAAYYRNGKTTNGGFNFIADYTVSGANGLDQTYSNLTGTVLTDHTTALVGTNTLFTTELRIGDMVYLTQPVGGAELRRVTEITDATHLTMHHASDNAESSTFSKRNWLAVYVCTSAKGDRVCSLLSASFETPRLPPGYSYSRRVGAVRFADTTTNVEQFWRFNRHGDYTAWNEDITLVPFLVLDDTAGSITYVKVKCNAVVPPSSTKIQVGYYIADNDSEMGITFKGDQQTNVIFGVDPYYGFYAAIGGGTAVTLFGVADIMCSPMQIIQYRNDEAANAQNHILVAGYYDPV